MIARLKKKTSRKIQELQVQTKTKANTRLE